jgi:hypothetical protein
MHKPLKIVAVTGLALGGIFGMLGTFVANPNLRALSWALDSTSLVVATSLLAIFYFRKSNDFVAAGFLVFAIGEGVMFSATAGTLEASVPAFAAGISLWTAALLLTCIPPTFVVWTRFAGILGALLFAITAVRIFAGQQLLPTSKPLPNMAYPFLVLTFIGWIWTVLKTSD